MELQLACIWVGESTPSALAESVGCERSELRFKSTGTQFPTRPNCGSTDPRPYPYQITCNCYLYSNTFCFIFPCTLSNHWPLAGFCDIQQLHCLILGNFQPVCPLAGCCTGALSGVWNLVSHDLAFVLYVFSYSVSQSSFSWAQADS